MLAADDDQRAEHFGQRRGMAFVSHRLQEVLENCDRVVVLRDGQTVTEAATQALSVLDIEKMLVGQDFSGDRFRVDDNHL